MKRLSRSGLGMICFAALAWTLGAPGELFAGHHHHGSSGGSWGSHGSSGGSWGSHGSSGGSWGSHGSSGGSSGGGHASAANGQPVYAQNSGRAWMVMTVPKDAVVYLEKQRMTLTGTERKYYTPPLEAGKNFVYTIKVEVAHGERVLSTTSKVKVSANRNLQLTFTEQKAGELVSSIAPLGRN